MDKKIGFIGCGNMGKAILLGLISSESVSPRQIFGYDIVSEITDTLARQNGIVAADSAAALAQQTDIIFLAVKPDVIRTSLQDIAPWLQPHHILISIAAGITIETITSIIGRDKKVVRVMPNTPALVRAAICSLTPNEQVTPQEYTLVSQIIGSVGRCERVAEHLIHAVTGVSGSAPAFIFILIEAMADAAVAGGLSRHQAYQFAAQTVLGSARLVLESGQHPAVLKDNVCSPGGTTIDGVSVLEEKGFRAAIIQAVQASTQKSIRLSQDSSR
ncbi:MULTISPECIES: pyrroline-5-carboxylate reductase [unclassified Brenneria]|uniref:pyrroline-5-carboxylate reductase n=1 Tax=unclassified Brenneria TaxID=2634434 RepID=UPI0018F0D126|nr:pyrroline-5-carboxylate reductase [Brenneria sp. L3-3C-1]MBJ7220358.1 pyrroline-5-carboxylate reductase [Brenneria sp. L3-3C-1]MEE3641603.1 pyrroline-5-carboxylate reductase [Brenneria sp. L3_3C_1]